MEYKRKIFPEEVALIAFLASKAQFQLESNWENKFIAYPLTKEKIGSIGLFKNNQKYFNAPDSGSKKMTGIKVR